MGEMETLHTAVLRLLNAKASEEDGQGPSGTRFGLSSNAGNYYSDRARNQAQNKKDLKFLVIRITEGVRYHIIQSPLVSKPLKACVCNMVILYNYVGNKSISLDMSHECKHSSPPKLRKLSLICNQQHYLTFRVDTA